MAPSRGMQHTPHPTSKIHEHDNDDLAIEQQSSSALLNARRNFNFFISPSTATDKPARLRTRAFLRTFRYISQFILWRLVRWAKYAAIASVVAAVGATAFGSAVTGVAWIAAPTGIGASILAATIWGVGKFVARRLNKRWKSMGGDEGLAAREQEEDNGGGLKREGTLGQEMGPRAMPW